MRNLFEHTSASWVYYSDYEWKNAKDGHTYLLPTKSAKPKPYDPMAVAEELVLNAMDIGLKLFERAPEEQVKAAIQDFACQYGLLGIMTALPTTAKFIEINSVVLPVNDLIRANTMPVPEYVTLFFPFEKPDFTGSRDENHWNITDTMEQALALTYDGYPEAQVMSFMRGYGERYDWLAAVFKDWAFTLVTSVLYYTDRATATPETLALYRKGMAAFDGNAPTYHIELREQPTLVWDFHSLLLGIKMLFSIMLTDEDKPLRMCRQCHRAFIARTANTRFCSQNCRKQHKDNHRKERES